MDVDVKFQVSAEGVECHEDAGLKALLFGEFQDELGRQARDTGEQFSVDGKEVPEFAGHGEGDVLPGGLRQGVQRGLDPVVGGFFAAGGAESGFAGMGDFLLGITGWAGQDMEAEKGGSADEEFENVGDDAAPDEFPMLQEEFPPVAVIQKDVSEFYPRYEFHTDQNIQQMKISKKKLPPLAA
jgi:hypothetical protein